jgi:uncharacterized protein (DUF4415 family)
MPRNPYRGALPAMGGTKTERLARERLLLNLRGLQEESVLDDDVRATVPEAWATLEADVDVTEKKVKVTLWLDASVAAFYRAMGNGYQARINRVLATFAQMRIGKVKALDAQVEGLGR